MKDYDKSKESTYLNYGDVNDLHGWVMPHNLREGRFKWVEKNLNLMKIS